MRPNISFPAGRFLLLSLIASLLAVLPFTAGLPGDFVLDDVPNIVNNEVIQLQQLDMDALVKVATAPQISGSLRALPTLTFALDFWRAGSMDAGAFKVTNIAIHALTTCALAWLFHAILLAAGIHAARARWFSLALALAWAVHPLQVSAVLYVVQRMQTMGTLFLVLALLAYVQARRAQIAGRSGRTGLLLSALLWAVAMGCKEDTVLLPAYALALELTVLRFAAADIGLAMRLRRAYLVATLAGIAVYLLLALPHFWQWEPYWGRNFSSTERLLTQARVLCMYLWQILLPLPAHMPFYYDWLQPSRSLLQPWTTLPSIILVLTLLGAAWRLRSRFPLFSLGVFLFFAAHFITSNVIGLELAFEHRNSFALIGGVLALGSLLAFVAGRLRFGPAARAASCMLLLVAIGGAAAVRSHAWSDGLIFARASTELAPHSARAWFGLCMDQFKKGGEAVKGNPNLDEAINACEKGTVAAPYALNSAATLIVLKTLRGDVSPHDWRGFQRRMNAVDMNWDNSRAPLILAYYARQDVPLDKKQMLEALATLARRTSLTPFNSASLGYFIMNDLGEPDQAIPYFEVAVSAASAGDPFPAQLMDELRAIDRPDLAEKVRQLALARYDKGRVP
ncbi:MAG TPA: hypothetical protein DD456_13805 [Stenotrophomonas sp.]|nr:hypothetical protein [Stenotrophomonas sp.]